MSPSISNRENREFATEIKFVIKSQLAEQIRDWARARLSPDPHAGGEGGDSYQITSLYFDTERLDVFHRRGSFGRSKYRIRRYGAGEYVFLERKLKTRGLLSKRRSVVRSNELSRLSEDEMVEENGAGDWFQRRLLVRRLNPVCQISYRRMARVATTPFGPIRLTMDDDLRASALDGLKFSENEGASLLSERMILEMKFRHALPALFKYLVEEFALTPKPFSKYRYAAASLGLTGVPDSGRQENFLTEYA